MARKSMSFLRGQEEVEGEDCGRDDGFAGCVGSYRGAIRKAELEKALASAPTSFLGRSAPLVESLIGLQRV